MKFIEIAFVILFIVQLKLQSNEAYRKDEIVIKQGLFNFTNFELIRPQTPKLPFPYKSEDVKYRNNKANIILAGTLTYPKNFEPKACVVLAHGSGGHTRNQDVGGHQTLFVLADYLTRNNIAVLRFDERGIGESTGNFTEATYQDFADDVIAGVEYMRKRKEFVSCKFGAIGHSKGGYTTILAANKSTIINFIVTLGGAGINGEELLIHSSETALKQDDLSEFDRKIMSTLPNLRELFSIIRNTESSDLMKQKAIEYIKTNINTTSQDEIDVYFSFTSPWFKDLLSMNPKSVLRNLKKQAFLGLWGSKDTQVLADENLRGVREGLKLAGNRRNKLWIIDGVNHMFQEAQTGWISEYFKLEETIAPYVLKFIVKWIFKTV